MFASHLVVSVGGGTGGGASLGAPFGLETMPAPQTELPGHLLLGARPLVYCTRSLDVAVANAVGLEWFRHVGRGPSRARYSHRVTR